MRINRLRLRARQLEMQKAQAAEQAELESAVSDLTKVTADFQAAVAAKTTGAPTVQSAINELRETVSEVQAEVAASADMVKVDPAVLTPDEARALAAKLIADADAAEKKT